MNVICQSTVEKINSAAQTKRTILECRKMWLNYGHMTKEKLARNFKAAMRTRRGPVFQAGLDPLEEHVIALIPTELVDEVEGENSAEMEDQEEIQGALLDPGYPQKESRKAGGQAGAILIRVVLLGLEEQKGEGGSGAGAWPRGAWKPCCCWKDSEHENRTTTNIFIFVGFEVVRELQSFLFALFMTMYILTISSNMLIIILVKFERKLHKPIYYLLSSFSFLEILYTTATVPKMLVTLLTEEKTISIPVCIAQFYFIFAFGACENYLLAVMAYDRYVAICNPLRYSQIMTSKTSCYLAIGAWTSAMLAPLLPALWISSLTFCTPNEIDHFFCDFAPLLKLSCQDTSVGQFTFLAIAWIVILGCCLMTMTSYIFIICSILRIPSIDGQKKAFNTCASHFTVLIIFYGTVIFMYIRPNSSIRFALDKVVSIFYCVVTPLLNPMIYSLRNKEKLNPSRNAPLEIIHLSYLFVGDCNKEITPSIDLCDIDNSQWEPPQEYFSNVNSTFFKFQDNTLKDLKYAILSHKSGSRVTTAHFVC
ncbi:olfactory receptor 6F1-like [Pleurodeles waltl]|uniref:olfactory receptor 6F1-like n=1 Tax=Pleurodeles waltl TaxID=8319 RepID=UPI00370958A5